MLYADAGFDWSVLSGLSASLSLFASTRLIELRVGNGKIGTDGSSALVDYCEQLAEDVTLLVIAERLEAGVRKSRWCKALEKAGVEVAVWPLRPAELPAWLNARMRSVGLQPDREVVQILAARTEGNLLAARQEIERLRLLHGPGAIGAEAVVGGVGDSARFDVFALVDAALGGSARRVIRILDALRGEGTAPQLALWALHRAAEQLGAMAFPGGAKGQGGYGAQQALLRQALARLSPAQCRHAVHLCALADRTVKGQRAGDPWEAVRGVALAMAGPAIGHAI